MRKIQAIFRDGNRKTWKIPKSWLEIHHQGWGLLSRFPIAKEVHPIPTVAVEKGIRAESRRLGQLVRPVASDVLRPRHIRRDARHDGSVLPLTSTYRCVQYTSAMPGIRLLCQISGAKDLTTSRILKNREAAKQPTGAAAQITSHRHKREVCTSPPQRVVCFRERGNFASLLSVSTSRNAQSP